MDETFLYQKIAEATRREILEGRLKPGERLPSVRQLCEQWKCTPGTIQRAYHLLVEEGLLVSRSGQGTQVAGAASHPQTETQGALRRAGLVNRAEAFLLEALTAGFVPAEIQQAVELAMDRWRAQEAGPGQQAAAPGGPLRFSGSHDMLLNDLAREFFRPDEGRDALHISYTGSLGGLIALSEGKADLAGCHLWDAESDSYNLPFIRRLLPGKAVSVITLAHRRIGLILAPGNPLHIAGIDDLARPGVRFINRQSGSGTRVWLDAHLARLGLLPGQIQGYKDECQTHSAAARVVAEGNADASLGLESAARAYGLAFIFLNLERYDLVMLAEMEKHPTIQVLVSWMRSPQGKAFIEQRPGYDSRETGLARSL
jgi:putative molybdopterin biosynthesis protein